MRKNGKKEEKDSVDVKVIGPLAGRIYGLMDHMNRQLGGNFITRHKLALQIMEAGFSVVAKRQNYKPESDNRP